MGRGHITSRHSEVSHLESCDQVDQTQCFFSSSSVLFLCNRGLHIIVIRRLRYTALLLSPWLPLRVPLLASCGRRFQFFRFGCCRSVSWCWLNFFDLRMLVGAPVTSGPFVSFRCRQHPTFL